MQKYRNRDRERERESEGEGKINNNYQQPSLGLVWFFFFAFALALALTLFQGRHDVYRADIKDTDDRLIYNKSKVANSFIYYARCGLFILRYTIIPYPIV